MAGAQCGDYMSMFDSRRNADSGNNVDGGLGCWGSGMVASGRGLWAAVFMSVVGSIRPGNRTALARHPGRRNPCATPRRNPTHGRIAYRISHAPRVHPARWPCSSCLP
jgi:hypothetical protein